jgi:hypothetical protein
MHHPVIQRESFLYMDLSVNNTPVFQGVPCLYGNKMVRYAYLGFKGDLVFIDSQGRTTRPMTVWAAGIPSTT